MVREMVAFCRSLYARVAYATGSVPTYTSGVIGYLLCGKDKVGWMCADGCAPSLVAISGLLESASTVNILI